MNASLVVAIVLALILGLGAGGTVRQFMDRNRPPSLRSIDGVVAGIMVPLFLIVVAMIVHTVTDVDFASKPPPTEIPRPKP